MLKAYEVDEVVKPAPCCDCKCPMKNLVKSAPFWIGLAATAAAVSYFIMRRKN